MTHIHIDHVENLTVVQRERPAIPRPRDRRRAVTLRGHLPLPIAPTCKGLGLAWPGKEQAQAAPSAPPMQMLRDAMRKPCAACGDTRQIMRNEPDFLGEFETAPCPVCSRERIADHHVEPAGRR